MLEVRFLFTSPESFLFTWIKLEFGRLSIQSTSRNTVICSQCHRLCESDYSDCGFDPAFHYGNYISLPLAMEWHHLALPLQNPIFPFAMILTKMYGLRGGAITELFRDSGASLTNLFCKALLKGISSDVPSVEEWVLCVKSILTFQPLNSFLYGKLKKIGHLQLTQIGPLLIHVSANKPNKP